VIEVRDAVSRQLLRNLAAGHGRVWALASSDAYIAAACGDGAVRTLCLNTDQRRTWAVAIDNTGEHLAASDGDGVVRVWGLPTGALIWEQPAHTGRIRSMTFAGGRGLLITGGGEGMVRIWQVADGSPVGEFTNPDGWVRAVSADEHGRRVAIGSGPGDIRVRDLDEDKFIAHFQGHTGRILMLGFTPGAGPLVSSAADGTVRSWSLPGREQISEARLDASLQCAGFDPASHNVVVGSATGVALITTGRSGR
jgi:WD40 repeat protein